MVFKNYLVTLLSLILSFSGPVYAENYPKRIISLGSAITEELFLLGVGECIVGNTVYCNQPEEAREKEKIGTIIKMNLEKVVALQPDLILATSLTDRQQLKKLKEMNFNVVEMPTEKNLEEICANFLKLGELVGKYKEAQDIIAEIKSKVELIKSQTRGLTKPKTLVEIGIEPLFVATKKYFIHDFIEMAGGINIAGDAQAGQYSREEVLRQNPDVILITTMGIAGEKEKKTWQKYNSLSAVRNNRIYIIDSDKFCSVTPASFLQILQEMVKVLHPELKDE